MNIERMSDVLEPKLDKESLRVLCAIPAGEEVATIWQVAERVDSTDLADVRLTLNGLVHLGYASTVSSARKRDLWWRTLKGDEAVSGSSREQAA